MVNSKWPAVQQILLFNTLKAEQTDEIFFFFFFKNEKVTFS